MRRALFAICSTVVGLVLLLSFKSQATSVTTPPVAIATPTPGATDSTGAASPGGAAATTGSGTGTKTITGASADTRWGPVQVQITVTNGTVTAATAVVYPQNNQRDVEINQFAIPQLNQEATAA